MLANECGGRKDNYKNKNPAEKNQTELKNTELTLYFLLAPLRWRNFEHILKVTKFLPNL